MPPTRSSPSPMPAAYALPMHLAGTGSIAGFSTERLGAWQPLEAPPIPFEAA